MKFCHRCKLAIDTKKERYIKIEDIEGTKTHSKVLMHKACWHELMTAKNEAKGVANMAKNFIADARNKMGMGDDSNPLILA